MQTHFQKELGELKDKLLTMASRAEAAVRNAVQALVLRDDSLADQVRAEDEVIDRHELELDEMAIRFLARAPMAGDLRLITVAMKLSHNLERVGDEATKIAKRAKELNEEPPLKDSPDISSMANLSLQMLKDSLDSFVNYDPLMARSVIPRDKGVDELNRRMHRRLVERMLEEPGTITRCLHLMVVVKSLERIADHAKNIAEEVVFLCEALDIRHPSAQSALAT
jgi:phosphate transport system protein